MTTHQTGTREQSLKARLELLKAEKESIGIPPYLSLPGPSILASVSVHDRHALGYVENATKSPHPTKEKKGKAQTN
jgi:hypothetical protein